MLFLKCTKWFIVHYCMVAKLLLIYRFRAILQIFAIHRQKNHKSES